jgi:hypothetical protein
MHSSARSKAAITNFAESDLEERKIEQSKIQYTFNVGALSVGLVRPSSTSSSSSSQSPALPQIEFDAVLRENNACYQQQLPLAIHGSWLGHFPNSARAEH